VLKAGLSGCFADGVSPPYRPAVLKDVTVSPSPQNAEAKRPALVPTGPQKIALKRVK